MTYQNPCISCMHTIIKRVITEKQISYQKLELIVVDAEQDDDREDLQDVLWQLTGGLNYLMLVTDSPDSFADYMDEVYDQTGLVVQHIPKSAERQVRGNLILDFERSGRSMGEYRKHPEIIYLPIYKKPWEIAENLDIMVPVGYNTLIVSGIFLTHPGECCSINEGFINEKIDRLDREFRRG